MSSDSVLLGDVCDITMGQAPSGDTYNSEGEGLPLIAGAGDFGVLSPEATKFTNAPTKVSRQGDVILCIRATIGDRNWSDIEYCLGRGVAGLAGRPQRLDQKYLWHWLDYVKPVLKSKGRGATFLQVNKADIASLEIPLPPLAEQRRIAAILDKADALRAKRREAIDKLDQLLQSVFLDMFGDPVRNPKRWPLAPLGSLCTNEDSKRRPIKQADREERSGPYPYYGASGIIDSYDDYLFDGERLLIAEDGANLVSRGTPIAFVARGKYWVNNHAHVLAESGATDLRFVERSLESMDLKPYITGSAQPKLNQSNLDRIELAVPPIELQRKFRTICERLEAAKTRATVQLEAIRVGFRSLQGRAFS